MLCLWDENQPCKCNEQDISCISEHEGHDQTIGCKGAWAGQAAAQLLWEGTMEKGAAKEANVFNSTYVTVSLEPRAQRPKA